MQNGGPRFVQLQDIINLPTSTMSTHFPQEAAKRRTPTKKLSKRSPKGIAKAIPGHLTPLIPGLESIQAHETKNMTDDLTTRAVGLEPHYDCEHFAPEDEQGYRGVVMEALRSYNARRFTIRPNRQRRKAESRTAAALNTRSPIYAYSHSHQASATVASYVRHHELTPDHTYQSRVIVDCVAHHELEAPNPKLAFVRTQIPKIVITPSSPTLVDFKFDVFDNMKLTPPPICYKRKERRHQVTADRERMLELVGSRSLGSFGNIDAADGMQSDVEPIRRGGSIGNVGVHRRVRRGVEPVFERYAYSLFG